MPKYSDNHWVPLAVTRHDDSKYDSAYSTVRGYIDQNRVRAKKARGRVFFWEPDLLAIEQGEEKLPRTEKAYDHVEAELQRIIATAPPLSDEQREQLAVIVRGGTSVGRREAALAGGVASA